MTTTYEILPGSDEALWFFEDTEDEAKWHILKTVTNDAGRLVVQEVVATTETYRQAVVAVARFHME